MNWKIRCAISITFKFVACYILALDAIFNCDKLVQSCSFKWSDIETLEQESKDPCKFFDLELKDPKDIVIYDEYSNN